MQGVLNLPWPFGRPNELDAESGKQRGHSRRVIASLSRLTLSLRRFLHLGNSCRMSPDPWRQVLEVVAY